MKKETFATLRVPPHRRHHSDTLIESQQSTVNVVAMHHKYQKQEFSVYNALR